MPDIFIGGTEHKEESEKTTKNSGKKVEIKSLLKADKEDKKHHNTHLFASYCEKPETLTFADKLDNEETLLFLRKHFITNVPWIVKAITLGIVPFLLILINLLGLISINFLPVNYILLILIFYYFIIFGYIFVNYLTWFYNISIVTTLRIIDIDFSQIVFENVAATKLTQIEDVHYSQIGVIRSVFDYGDVILQTAGTLPNFDFLAVPHPERVIKVIGNLIGEANNA